MKFRLFIIGLFLFICIQTKGQWTNITPNGFVGNSELLSSCYFATVDTGYIVGRYYLGNGAFGGLILRTKDGGSTWSIEYHSEMTALLGVCFRNCLFGFAIGGSILLNTKDGGESWSEITLPGDCGGGQQILMTDDSTFYIVTYDGICKSNDGGLTWYKIHNSFNLLRRATFSSGNQGLVVGCSINYWGWPWQMVVEKSSSTGIDWAYEAGFSALNCFSDIYCTHYGKCFVISGGGVVAKSSTGFSDWHLDTIDLSYGFNYVTFIDSLTGFISGGSLELGGYILKTKDGGETWYIPETDSLPYEMGEMSFPSKDVGYAISGNFTPVIAKYDERVLPPPPPEPTIDCFRVTNLSPNPTSDELQFVAELPPEEELLIEIVNVAGQKALQRSFVNSSPSEGLNLTEVIHLSELPNGYYFLMAQSKCGRVIKKIVVRKN